tara:strand:+ start:2282 stop:3064 length:783 start_codon:yes stop_codon:yes gene_type:complete
MAISRAQIPEEIKGYANGGPLEDLRAQLEAIQKGRQPITQQSLAERVAELQMLVPQRRRPSIYGLASNLSRGLVAQAQSGRPSSVGYGLAMGFNLFNEAEQKRQAEMMDMKEKLKLMAYEDLKREQAESDALKKSMAEAGFELAVEQMKNSGGYFQSKTVEAQALNLVLAGERDPNIKRTPEYKVALAYLQKPKKSLQQTETGMVEVEQPGLDIARILGQQEAPDGVPAGFSPLGKNDPSGKAIYYRKNADGTIDYAVEE